MEQINAVIFYDLAKWMEANYLMARQPIKEFLSTLDFARTILLILFQGNARYKLDESAGQAKIFLGIIDWIKKIHSENPDATLTADQVLTFNAAYDSFEGALRLELGRAPIFFVIPRGLYDTRRLIESGASVYEGFADRLPKDAIDDTNQSARCMAFGLPTAAGFHIARATEAVITMYMKAFGCPAPKESQRNWGKYVDLLEKTNANTKVVHHVDQLRALHRNPLIHPEVTLVTPEDSQLFALCVSVIQAMVADIETTTASPSPSIVAMLPSI